MTEQYNYLIKFPSIGVSYLDLPKTGCVSMKTTLFKNEYNYPQSVQFGVGHNSWRFLFPKCVVNTLEELDGLPLFSVLRNPYTRVVSMYRNIYIGRRARA